MPSNKKLLQDFEDLTALKARRKELELLEAKLRKELNNLEDRIFDAEQVSKVLDGIAISRKVANNGKHITLRTLATGKRVHTREAKVYQRVDTPYWAVAINGSAGGKLLFRIGPAIGLCDNLTKKEAQAIADRWLKGDKSVLNYRRSRK